MKFLAALTTLLLPLAAQATSDAKPAITELDINTTHSQECTRKTAAGDTVSMHYRGTLYADGSEFDSSYSRGKPLTFPLGKGYVIQGWDNGLLDMCIGDKRTLTIPPAMAYGDRGVGPIPAGSTLVFETELVGIEGVGKDEL
ncbi:peptidylprolyl isomerase family protein FPR2 [Aspergillus candidus]|uniref:peptidylprolyl isomerase n=1 Tax=Aspergillus candidus TaxID=41067 RepID=A0A2I2FC12_ASPCN|nr:putative FKBP-type peptidyl-prolyl isomerase [Aspergillus candidus]PLB38165.1 putative FKBP-type peptidyl-prolyl isomerase [Aspergillus candidus]